MEHKNFTPAKILLILFILTCLVVSVIISMKSVTGYIVSEKIDGNLNLSALVLFLSGLFGSILYLTKFR